MYEKSLEQIIQIKREKKAFFEQELTIVSSPEQKFELKKRIQKLEEEIQKLENSKNILLSLIVNANNSKKNIIFGSLIIFTFFIFIRNTFKNKAIESSNIIGIINLQSEQIIEQKKKILELQTEIKVLKSKVAEFDKSLNRVFDKTKVSEQIELVQKLLREYGYTDDQITAIFSDSSPTQEEKVFRAYMSLMKRIDQDIDNQAKLINKLQKDSHDNYTPSLDIETLRLKRMVDQRSKIFDNLRQITNKYEQSAQSIIDSIGR